MKRTIAVLTIVALGLPSCAYADFQYTEKTSITGGMMSGAMRFAGAFNHNAAEPQVVTHSVKGNRMRTDRPDGTSEIIDLDGRRVISIDAKKKTYSVLTFDQMKANMAKMQQSSQANNAGANTTVKPEFQLTEGTGTQMILGQETHEVKTRLNMTIQTQASDKAQAESGAAAAGTPVTITTTTNVDSWIAPSIAGYEELNQFYAKMAQEMGKGMDWMPKGGIHVDPVMSQSMAEMRKNAAMTKGFPLLTYTSISNTGVSAGGTTAAQGQGNSGSQVTGATSPQDAATLAAMNKLGGLFGRRNKKPDEPAPQAQGATVPPPPPSNPNALMETTTQVLSFSSAGLDSSLFDIPAGYTQLQPPAET